MDTNKGISMKAKCFIFSKKQSQLAGRVSTFVFIGGEFIPYTEMNSTGKSGWDDAVHLGIAPMWWIKVCGVIQDEVLAAFLNIPDWSKILKK